MYLSLSQKTKAISRHLAALNDPVCAPISALIDAEEVHVDDLLSLLGRAPVPVCPASRLLLEKLDHACLVDLCESLALPVEKPVVTKKKRWRAWAKTALVILAGTIYFAFEGFDGIASMLGLTTLPSLPIVFFGLAFAALWTTVFFLVELRELSNRLGVKFKSATNIVDVYLRQMNMMKAIRKKIDSDYTSRDEAELNQRKAILAMLLYRLDAMEAARDSMKQALNRPILKLCKYSMALLTGVVIFTGGFMAGQTVALAFAGLIVATVSSTAWPVMLVAAIAGLAAFSYYWYVNRHDIENLIGRCIGLDKEKISALCDNEAVDKEKEKLGLLTAKLGAREELIAENARLREENRHLGALLATRETNCDNLSESFSRHSFFSSETSEQDTFFSESDSTEFLQSVACSL